MPSVVPRVLASRAWEALEQGRRFPAPPPSPAGPPPSFPAPARPPCMPELELFVSSVQALMAFF
eukprot:3153138-Prymnesium_polylepis.1